MNTKDKRAAVTAALATLGWQRDRFGHFKNADGRLRVKMQATSVRLERKVDYPATEYLPARSEWFKITGAYLRDVRVLEDGRVVIGSKVVGRR